MSGPQTEAGKALLTALWGVYAPGVERDGPVRARLADIEAESRNATLDEVVRAVEGLVATCHSRSGLSCEHVEGWPGVPGSESEMCNTDVSRAAVLDAVKVLRG